MRRFSLLVLRSVLAREVAAVVTAGSVGGGGVRVGRGGVGVSRGGVGDGSSVGVGCDGGGRYGSWVVGVFAWPVTSIILGTVVWVTYKLKSKWLDYCIFLRNRCLNRVGEVSGSFYRNKLTYHRIII